MQQEEDDDSGPPPLSSLANQVQALLLEPSSERRTDLIDEDDGKLPIASTTLVGQKDHASSKTKGEGTPIKRGFFDVKPKPVRDPPMPSAPHSRLPVDSKTAIEELRGRKGGSGPSIPDFMRVEPDAENEKWLKEVKGKLVEALKPTPELLSSLSSDPRAMNGFDDPEVMAAVDEIGKDPRAMVKYKDNKKVQEFYQAMALVMGSKLEGMGNKPL